MVTSVREAAERVCAEVKVSTKPAIAATSSRNLVHWGRPYSMVVVFLYNID
jgi:hypothetical protein